MRKRAWMLWLLLSIFASYSYGKGENAHEFDFMIVPTGVDQQMDAWYKTPPESIPHLSSVSEVTKGQKFMIALFFNNYQLDKDGSVNITFDVLVRKPDGSVYFEQKNLNGVSRKVQPGVLLLNESIVGINFDPPDPWGEYSISVTASDNIGKKSRKQSVGITLKPWQLGKEPGTKEEFDKWGRDYHVSPRPNEAVHAFLEHCPLTDDKGELAVAGLYLFKVIFQENPYLIDHLAAQFKKASLEQQQKSIVLLHMLGKLDKVSIPAALAEFKSKALQINLPDPYGETLSGHQQDMLWTEFLATGRIKPIRKLISNLEYSKYAGSIEEFRKSRQTDQDKMNAYKDALFQSAVWSIQSNCKQHELVARYCVFLYENGDLTANEKKWLGLLLSKVFEKDKDAESPAKSH